MDEDRKLPVLKHTVTIDHPDDEDREFVLEDVLVIPPQADWSGVPTLETLSAEGTQAVLMNFIDFAKLVLDETGEHENYQPFTLN